MLKTAGSYLNLESLAIVGITLISQCTQVQMGRHSKFALVAQVRRYGKMGQIITVSGISKAWSLLLCVSVIKHV